MFVLNVDIKTNITLGKMSWLRSKKSYNYLYYNS